MSTTLKVALHNEEDFIVEVEEYDVHGMEEKLNDRDIMVVAIGNIIVSKNMIKTIAPTDTEPVVAK